MPIRILVFLSSFFLFGTFNVAFSQFDPLNFDKKFLEHEIKVLIDSVRISHKLPALYNDSILYVASDHHSKYMLSKGALSHEETGSKNYVNPQQRAYTFGAPKSYLVGENVAFTPYNARVKSKDKIFITNSYREIARCLVFSWVNSKGHYKNIITPDYQVTGLSVSVDPKTQRVYACQKFAQILYTYSFTENESFFPYSGSDIHLPPTVIVTTPEKFVYPFELRADKVNECEECKAVWANYPSISVRVSNNYFILRVEDADFVKQLIKNKNDGFAVEVVPFEPFACGNPAYENEPSRRNEMSRTSGKVLQPIYRNDLIKGFKKRKKVENLSFVKYIFKADSVSFFKRFGRYKLENFNAKYFEIKLGKIPKDVNGWWNHNLMYIHNKQICHFVYLTNYPGELSTEMIDAAYYPPVPKNNYNFMLEGFSDTLELFYQPGQTITESPALKNTIKNFEQQFLTVRKIEIEGFCSVEGDSLTNEMLHQKRAQNILSDLKSLTNSETKYSVRSKVAWEHFYSSVKDHPKWKFLFPMSKAEISKYLANPKSEKPLEILAKERKVKVVITAVKELSPKTAVYYVNRDIRRLFVKDDRGEIRCRNNDSLERIYEKAYYLSTVDTISVKDFLKIEVPKFKNRSHVLDHDMAFYHYEYERKTADKNRLTALESKIESVFATCGAPDHLTPEFHYLSANLLIKRLEREGKKVNAPESPNIKKALSRLSMLLESYDDLDSTFYLNVSKANLNLINIICRNIDPDKIYEYSNIANSSLIQIIEFYRRTNQLNPATVLKLAKTLCYFKNVSLAAALCRDFLYDNEVLKLYLPLSYVHTSYLSGQDEIDYETEYHQLLLDAKTKLKPEEWCRLFYGQNGIPFQLMDNKKLHDEFCASCPDRVNEVFGE